MGYLRLVVHLVCMPHYYFNLYNERTVADPEGTDLPDLSAVRNHAVADVRELMAEGVKKGRINFNHRIEVADQCGRLVLTVPFSEAVSIAA